MISVFDMFKVGIGPSSSHTVGPMKAAKQFIDELISRKLLSKINRLQANVYGSLSLTGRGHNTDIAVIMGLMGYLPDNVDIEEIEPTVEKIKQEKSIVLAEADPINAKEIPFDFFQDMPFHTNFLARHENGMELKAFEGETLLFAKTYYSIGGGFIVDDENFEQAKSDEIQVPFPYRYAKDLLEHCSEQGLPLSSLMWKNELAHLSRPEHSRTKRKLLGKAHFTFANG